MKARPTPTMPATADGRSSPATRRRILMLLGNNPYPEDTRVHHEAESLVAAGYHVSVIAPRTVGQARRANVEGVDVHRYWNPVSPTSALGYVVEYAAATFFAFAISLRILVRGGFDVVHAHNPPDTFVVVGAFFRLLGKRFVFDHHDLGPDMYTARFGAESKRTVEKALRIFERLSCRLANHVIATNESYREVEMERYRVPSERITIVRNGIDLKRILPVAPDPSIRARADLILGYVGAMGYQDGVDYLLRAVWHLVNDLGQQSTLCILIGEGDAFDDLRRQARELDIDDHVWFTGLIPDDEMIRYLCTADICVDPDPANAFNDKSTMIKMMEFLGLGRPTVCFDLTEHRRSAQDAAVYVEPNDEMAMAKAIVELMRDPDRRRRIGEIGRRRGVEVFSWTHSEASLFAAYSSIFES
jgi:glycosyltransferase involved in cell wall biosynthesis